MASKLNEPIPGKQSHWFFSVERLISSPSFKHHGLDSDKELLCRQNAAQFIQEVGQKLSLAQLCMNTAIVYMHRFYVYHSFVKFPYEEMSASCIFLAAKVEESPRRLEHVVRVSHALSPSHKGDFLDPNSNKFLDEAQKIIIFENVLLQTLGFDLQIEHPHSHVVKCCQLVKAPKELAQASYFLATDTLHLSNFCVRFRPTVIACVCIHLACKWANWEIPDSQEGKPWHYYVDSALTKDLIHAITSELLAVMEKSPNKLTLRMRRQMAGIVPFEHASSSSAPQSKQRKLDAAKSTTNCQENSFSLVPGSLQHSINLSQNSVINFGETKSGVLDLNKYKERQAQKSNTPKNTLDQSVSPNAMSNFSNASMRYAPPSQRKSFMPDTSMKDTWMASELASGSHSEETLELETSSSFKDVQINSRHYSHSPNEKLKVPHNESHSNSVHRVHHRDRHKEKGSHSSHKRHHRHSHKDNKRKADGHYSKSESMQVSKSNYLNANEPYFQSKSERLSPDMKRIRTCSNSNALDDGNDVQNSDIERIGYYKPHLHKPKVNEEVCCDASSAQTLEKTDRSLAKLKSTHSSKSYHSNSSASETTTALSIKVDPISLDNSAPSIDESAIINAAKRDYITSSKCDLNFSPDTKATNANASTDIKRVNSCLTVGSGINRDIDENSAKLAELKRKQLQKRIGGNSSTIAPFCLLAAPPPPPPPPPSDCPMLTRSTSPPPPPPPLNSVSTL